MLIDVVNGGECNMAARKKSARKRKPATKARKKSSRKK